MPAVAATAAPQADINGEDRGDDNSKGDDEGGKGDGGRGYKDNGDDGDNDGGDGGNDDTKRRQTQQPNIKPTSTARNVVVMTARAMTKAARATTAGATMMTAMMMTTAATAAKRRLMAQRQRGWHLPPSTMHGHYSQEHRCRETRPAADQSRWCHARLSPFVGVDAGLTSPVGIGKDGGHDGWLCWGWRGGFVDHWGTKNKIGEGKNLACGRG